MFVEGICFNGFEGREEALKSTSRFRNYNPMFYRTNLWIHTRRVSWIVRELAPHVNRHYSPNFDLELAFTLSLVHDDAEIIKGDTLLSEKLKMTDEELRDLSEVEEEAILVLKDRYPKEINGFNYEELLYQALEKDTLEAQIVSLCDKLDGFGESLHELFSGNEIFCHPVLEYIPILKEFPLKYPRLKGLFTSKHPLLSSPNDIDVVEVIRNSRVHQKIRFTGPSGDRHYDAWKDITLRYGDREDIELLVTPSEYFNSQGFTK